MTKEFFFSLSLCAISFTANAHKKAITTQLPLTLWYNQEAHAFEESLPIGNGKLGALVYGGADNDSIYLNDITLWTGQPVNPQEGGDAYKWIPKIREALFKEDYKTADSLQHFVQGHNSEYYQPLGLIQIKDFNQGKISNYHRQLSLDSSLVSISFVRNEVTFNKEYFASHPDKMIAIRLSASKKGAINSDISLTSLIPHRVKASEKQLTMSGHVMGEEENSIHYCSILQVKNTDGSISASDSTLHLTGVTEAIIYLVNETSYNGFDKHPVKEGAPYLENVTDDIWHLTNFTYKELRQRHLSDYKKLFDRVKFNLSDAKYDVQNPTDKQLLSYSDENKHNPYLEMLYFQYGRYLLISSSLMEWYHDWDDQDWHHRHQSTLLGLYPFHQISLAQTPDLAQAATKTLEIKGDKSTGWSTGWRINLWARLHRQDKAYQILRKLLTYVSPEKYKDRKHHSGGTYPNLFDAHPPFQIDGNFGGTAGICEMLMQCDGENMDLLPALPDSWQQGNIQGIKARGNYTLNLYWKDKKVSKAEIISHADGKLTVNYNGKSQKITLKKGTKKVLR